MVRGFILILRIAGGLFLPEARPCRVDNPRIEIPDPPFPIKQGRFPLPGVIKLDPLCLPPNAEPLDFMLAVMRDKSQPMWRRIEAAKAAAPYRLPRDVG